MSAELSIIEGEYLRDLLDQPQALRDTLAASKPQRILKEFSARLRSGGFRTIALTGMGSSFYALHPLHLKLIAGNFFSAMLETSELIHYQKQLLGPQTLVVAVSQSGHSAEVVHLLEINGRRSPVIAITNTAESPLAKQSDARILTQAGEEFSVSCKTYVATLIALEWLGDALCERDLRQTGGELERAASAAESYLRDWEKHVREFAGLLHGIRHLFFVGRGASLATVGTGALIVKESDHFHAEGMSSAAFRHGPMEMLGDETFVLIFEGDDRTRDLNRRLLEDIQRKRGRAELIAADAPLASCRLPASLDSIRPILEILPVQLITLALAALAGREAGRFELASKITTTE
jgi:glutamine---fructose-6-phosphate transaminase (isomerizing)